MAYTNLFVAPAAAVLLLLAFTWLLTNLRYQLAMRRKDAVVVPAQIPYTVPWLGSALDFMTPRPGAFFTKLLAQQPREAGACKVLLGGQSLYVLKAPSAVRALYKLKSSVANRDRDDEVIMERCCGLDEQDNEKYMTIKDRSSQLSHEYMLKPSCANDLAREFVVSFGDVLRTEAEALRKGGGPGQDVDLYAWLRRLQFQASCAAFMGQHINEVYPDFFKDFDPWDRSFMDLFFQIPEFLTPQSYAARETAVDGLAKWIEAVDRATGGAVPDPDVPNAAWEPHWGSRLLRARQALWLSAGMSPRGRAGMELGFVFGLNSNAIPITGWLLMHILDPANPGLLARVRAEVERAAARGADGRVELDVPRLSALPLLQSAVHETLRLYTDVLITRELFEDVRLPLDGDDDGGKDGLQSRRWLALEKGSRTLAPSLMNHWDPYNFPDPPAHVFCAERFLVPAPDQDGSGGGDNNKGGAEYVFSTAADGGKMWPWGGGKTMCPGRLFAKQEVLAAVALVLLSFDMRPVDERPYKIPGFADAKPGTAGLAPGGDVRVNLNPRI